jgi:hypothetical protein
VIMREKGCCYSSGSKSPPWRRALRRFSSSATRDGLTGFS